MKKILLSLFAVLMTVGAWAQTATGGPEVTFTNVQKDGKEYVLFINDAGELAISSESAEALGASAKFRLTVQENGKFTFYNEAKSLYMIWRGKGHGANGDKGVMADYDAAFCDWELGDGSSAVAGTYYLKGKRGNGGDGSIVIMNAGTFDAYGYSVGYDKDSKFSNLFKIGGLESVTYKYSINFNGKTYGSQEMTGMVGISDYATPNLPVGITATIPQGKVQVSDAGKTIELTCTLSNCPVEFAADANSITKWYYLRLHSNQTKFIQYLEGENYIEWNDASFNADEIDSHLWGLVGNPFEVKLISKAANAGVVSTGDGDANVGAEATAFFMAKSDVSGADKFTLQFPGGNCLNGQNGRVKHWSAKDAGSTFIPTLFEEEEVKVAATEFATLYMAYQAYIPEGVEAYIVSGADSKKATLTKIEGILPANTGVVLKNDGNYSFKKAIGTAADVTGNLLLGSTTDTEVTGKGYVLSTVNNVTGFYAAELTDGKFKNNAGKAYLPKPAEASARFISLDFGTETAIESVESVENNAAVYDLSGRRVQKAQKGLYIVNGKVVIK